MRSLSGASLAIRRRCWPWGLGRRLRQVGELQVDEGVQSRQPGVSAAGLQEGGRRSTRRRFSLAGPAARHQCLLLSRATATTNQYKPSKKGEPENDALLPEGGRELPEGRRNAVGLRPTPADKKLGKLSLEYLVAAYGADKLNDPAKAEPVVQKMIQLEPGEPTNYFQLAKIYEDAGVYDEAEKVSISRQRRPNRRDPAVYMQLAGYYNRQGQFDKTIEALEERATKRSRTIPRRFTPSRPSTGTRPIRDFKLKEAEKKDFVREGRPGGRSRAADQAGLHRSARLQGPPPSAPGEHGEGPAKQQAAACKQADQLRDKAQRTAQAEGRRRQRLTTHVRATTLGSRAAGHHPAAFFMPTVIPPRYRTAVFRGIFLMFRFRTGVSCAWFVSTRNRMSDHLGVIQ